MAAFAGALLGAGVIGGIYGKYFCVKDDALGHRSKILNKTTRLGAYCMLGGVLTEIIGKVTGMSLFENGGKLLMSLGSGTMLGAQLERKKINYGIDKTSERLIFASAVTLLARIGFGIVSFVK